MTLPTRTLQDRTTRRVVCAALRFRNTLVVGPRHFDGVMHAQIERLGGAWGKADEGFIDQWGKFMDRKEAFEIATAANQIRWKSGNPNSTELFSEDLY